LKDTLARLAPAALADGEDVVQVRLDGEFSLRQMADKLSAFDDICEAVRGILLGFQLEVDFRVLKVESGSLDISVVAQKLGIVALRRVLAGGVDFLYRNHTNEGRLRYGTRGATSALKEVVKLRHALAKEGVDVEGIDEALAKQTELLVNRIGTLSCLDAKISVDGEPLGRREPFISMEVPRIPSGTAVAPQIGFAPGAGDGGERT